MTVFLRSALLVYIAMVAQARTPLLGGWVQHENPSSSLKFFQLAFKVLGPTVDPPYNSGTNMRIVKSSTQEVFSTLSPPPGKPEKKMEILKAVKYKIIVEIADITCGFQRLEQNATTIKKRSKKLYCWTGKVTEICRLELFELMKTKNVTVRYMNCKKP
uniref:Putative conserved secreted protein n=1 Tax=Amblyomma tuberculatum TaxID=48802 RepID=A0A6M2E5H1_9ACAR